MRSGWPQGIYLFLVAMGFGVAVAKHGEPRPPHSMGMAFLAICITFPLLWWGGFFTN